MKNKIFILFILIFIFMTGSVFAATTDLMTVNIAQDILDFYSDPAHITQTSSASYVSNIETWKTNLFANYSNVTAEEFTNIYNLYYVPAIESLNFNEHISFNNICIYSSINSSGLNLKFVISNNTASNIFGYTEIDKESNAVVLRFKDGYIYELNMLIEFEGNIFNNLGQAEISHISYVRTYPTINPTFDSNDEKIFINYQLALSPIQSIYYADNNKYYFVGNFVNAHGEINSGDIESGDNSGDTGGGTVTPSGDDTETTTPDYSEQLNNIQGSIDNVNQNLDDIENKIPTSGDIQHSTTVGVVQGNTDYWGSSGDLDIENQEELISDKIDELTDTLSGDLFENEIFGILQKYEDKIFGSFIGEEDFVISWNDVTYMNTILIPAGEVNFSEMCRENEALSNVKNVVNIILTFTILMNLVIYLYNLLLATLGIDNPYLYEKPVGSVTVAEYTDEAGRTFVTQTQHDGRGNSISKRYDKTIVPKKRQIGFRKW